MNEHDRWSEEVAAYVLGALDAESAAGLEAHAESCERCRSEIRWLTSAVEALAEAPPRREPPPQLRERLLSEVDADVRAESPGVEPGGLRGWLAGVRIGSLTWKPLVGLVAVVLVVAVVAGYVVGNDSGGGEGGATYSGAEGAITAEVVRQGDGAELNLAHVAELPPDRVLEAWVQREGTVEPVKALFVPDRDGNASTMINDMSGVEVVMVTREPAGGTAAPTSTPIVTVPIKD